jgi:S-adenosylmethionine:diacylglycerol 3-amino-3-carboxypropyl transferase
MKPPETMWRLGSHLLFGQMYEDVEIEARTFRPGSRAFVIASAGDSAIALSRWHEVTAVDINPAQIAYAQARAAGGPARRGLVELIMHIKRRFMAVAGWTPKRLEQFVSMSDCEKQLAFWQEKLNNPLFRFVFDSSVISALCTLRVIAPSRAFLPPWQTGPRLRKRLRRGFARYPNNSNVYAQRLIAGHLVPERMEAVHPIRFVHGDAIEILEQSAAGSFEAFSLSNIADGATAEFSRRLFAAVRHAAAPDAVLVLRSFRESENPNLSETAAQDRSMLWGSIYAGPVRSFPPCSIC